MGFLLSNSALSRISLSACILSSWRLLLYTYSSIKLEVKLEVELLIWTLFHLLYPLLLDLKQSTVVPISEKHYYNISIYIY